MVESESNCSNEFETAFCNAAVLHFRHSTTTLMSLPVLIIDPFEGCLIKIQFLKCCRSLLLQALLNNHWIPDKNSSSGIYIYIYESHTINFQTFFVWAFLLIVLT